VRRRGGIFAARNLLDVFPEVQRLARSPVIRELVVPVLGSDCFPVRGILFDKIPGANWKVPWHQDVTIVVQDKIEIEGFGPWSTKADVLHVQPPAMVLENMLSVRLHLDACGEDNGALRVIAGSHQRPDSRRKDFISSSCWSREGVCCRKRRSAPDAPSATPRILAIARSGTSQSHPPRFRFSPVTARHELVFGAGSPAPYSGP
jgi:hypothetical protein